MLFYLLTWLVVVSAVSFTGYRLYCKSSVLPLPPGPKPKLFTGNLYQLPSTDKWKFYKDWSRLYGPIFLYSVYGSKVVVLNTFKTANDLLEGRSNLYSSRPHSWMSHVLKRGPTVFNVPLQHPRHKIYRRLLHSGLSSRAVRGYYDLMDRESRILAENLSNSPGDFIKHLRRNAGAIILQMAYGWTVTETDDRLVTLMEEAFALSARISKLGQWLNIFPAIRFIPSWFPGGSFKNKIKEYKKLLSSVDDFPYEWAKETINSGTYIPSFTSHHLVPEDGHKLNAQEEDIIKWCSSALYVGGADTTVAFMTAFIAAMVLYPSVQEKARREVDQVVGSRRPQFEDQASLPYVSALIKEVLRWAPPAPLGLQHHVIQDDIYSGYLIPKGTTVLANIRGMANDENIYPNPTEFLPERYLGSSPQLDPHKFVFGFGRRVCPGSAFAEASVFINVTGILSLFTISKARDADGREITPKLEFTEAVTSHINPFPCTIERRPDRIL